MTTYAEKLQKEKENIKNIYIEEKNDKEQLQNEMNKIKNEIYEKNNYILIIEQEVTNFFKLIIIFFL